MERRLFVKNALATTAGAFVIPTIIPSNVIGKNSPGNKINIGLIGCGRIARDHNLPEILKYDNVRLIAVCDLDSKRLADGKKFIEDYYTKKTGSPGYIDIKMYDDYRKLLHNPEIDAVIICTTRSLACTISHRSSACQERYLFTKTCHPYGCRGSTPE